MCGIVGAVARENVVPTLIEGIRRLEYRGYDSSGLARADRGDRVGAAKLGHRFAHRRQQVAVVVRVDKMDDHLGVGLSDESVSLVLQPRAQGFEVFDDAVVNHCDLIVADMGMRVGGCRRAMRRPAGM